MGERCGCSFSTLPGKQLRCAEATRHQGPHHADGVTWPKLFPKRSEEVPDARHRLGLEGRAPATTAAPTDLDQAIQAAITAAAIALSIHSIQDPIADWTTMAKVAVEAAWPLVTAEIDQLDHARSDLYDELRAARDDNDRLQEFEQAIVDALGVLRWDLVSAALIKLHAADLDQGVAQGGEP